MSHKSVFIAKIAAELAEIRRELRRLAAETSSTKDGDLKLPKKFTPASLKKFLKDPSAAKLLKGADLSGLKALSLKAKNMDFQGTDLSTSSLSDGDFSGTDFRGAKLRYTALGRSKLKGADFSGTTLDGTYLEQCDFTGAKLVGTKFKGTSLASAIMSGANLQGADFTMVSAGDLKTVDFSGAKNLNKAKFPEGFTPSDK